LPVGETEIPFTEGKGRGELYPVVSLVWEGVGVFGWFGVGGGWGVGLVCLGELTQEEDNYRSTRNRGK